MQYQSLQLKPRFTEELHLQERRQQLPALLQYELQYTVNTTIIENFGYIDPQSPKDGVAINYLPYITRTTSDTEIN